MRQEQDDGAAMDADLRAEHLGGQAAPGPDLPNGQARPDDANADSAAELREVIREAVSALTALDIHELRIRWRKEFRKTAPEHLPRWLLIRMIAYRIQAKAFGDLDAATVRFLDRVGKARQERIARGEKLPPRSVPPVPPPPGRRRFRTGTILAREHDGTMQRVIVVETGYLWNGVTYASLSAVAKAITGTNWNGPRFFGLKDTGESP